MSSQLLSPVARPPQQARGQRSAQRMVEAVERMLQHKSFNEISVADIVRESGSSVGAFYHRFASKEALLPLLYERYNAKGFEDLRSVARSADAPGAGVRRVVTTLSAMLSKHSWLMRAVTLFARSSPESLPASARERSLELYEVTAQLLGRSRDSGTEPQPRFATFVIATLLRERALFAEAPLSAALGLEEDAFEAELVSMVEAYLAAPDTSGGKDSS